MKIFGFLLLITLSTCYSCKEELFTELPPETQTGEHTFGCYVNGELFVAQRGYAFFGQPYLIAEYLVSANYLKISAYGKSGLISFDGFYPETENVVSIDRAKYRNTLKNLFYEVNNAPIGEIYFTKFDTINNIVSGTFSCKTRLNNNVDSIAYLTQGRFDIELTKYYD
ncbi:MAG: hypothetical protein LBT25_13965 [Candidatus Symbiothrix sp.]|jgi:hypothetical protein|nr:hypothetical protein [Candidatus Symbiothrix sp.]